MVRVKICGVKRIEDALASAASGADAIGLNFYPKSSRYVGTPKTAQALVRAVGTSGATQWAGVFVNPAPEEVLDAVQHASLAIVQLHGDEPPEFVERLAQRLGPGIALWKAFPVAAPQDLQMLSAYRCDAWLVDARCESHGGSGMVFDWKILEHLKRDKPLVLAGGLSPENVAEAVRQVKPDWVDVASGVELSPGMKNPALIARFIQLAKSAI